MDVAVAAKSSPEPDPDGDVQDALDRARVPAGGLNPLVEDVPGTKPEAGGDHQRQAEAEQHESRVQPDQALGSSIS